jgi:hypothetical protein
LRLAAASPPAPSPASKGGRTVVGIQCDNPKLSSLDNWQCCWSCWQKVADRYPDVGPAPEG